jgi:hypothetical protein
MKDMTKKLKTLVKKRKTPIVITKQGSIKINKKYDSDSIDSYCYTSYNN